MYITEQTQNQIMKTMSEFKCVRRDALIEYIACTLIEDKIIERRKNVDLLEIAEKVYGELIKNKFLFNCVYAGTKTVTIDKDTVIYFELMDSFEIFVKIVEEMMEKGCKCGQVHGGLSNYPYDSVISTNKHFYRLISYAGSDLAKINFHNATFKNDEKSNFVTILIVPEKYSSVEFDNVEISGKYRIALISQDNKHFSCTLSDISGK